MAPFVTAVDDDGAEIRVRARFEVCSRCDGEGTHTNPSIDGDGLTAEDFDGDPDFFEDYMAGVYDLPCEECRGVRVVAVGCDTDPNYQLWVDHEREIAELRAEEAAERAMGA